MQTILIPTDFSLSSLDCIPELCKQHKDDELTLVFVHLFKLSDSISDLLMLSRRSKEYEYVSDAFYQQCETLKNSFTNLNTIRIEFFYGSTLSMFKNFLEAHEVNGILHPEHCSCVNLNKSSINPAVLINKCGLPDVRILKSEAEIIQMPLATELLQMAEA